MLNILSWFLIADTLVWWGVRLIRSGLDAVVLFRVTDAWPWSWACSCVARLSCLVCG